MLERLPEHFVLVNKTKIFICIAALLLAACSHNGGEGRSDKDSTMMCVSDVECTEGSSREDYMRGGGSGM